MNSIRISISAVAILFCIAASGYAQRSLYSDVKAHKAGDVITVVLTENITGSSATDMRNQSSTAGNASSSVGGSMLPFDAAFGADAQLTYNSDERGVANQRQLLAGSLSVRIIDIDENGNYHIAGNRRTEISGEVYKMELQGYVRARDINDANEVLSFRIANAEITFLNQGGIKSMTHKKGFKRRVIWGVIGVATGVFTVMAVN